MREGSSLSLSFTDCEKSSVERRRIKKGKALKANLVKAESELADSKFDTLTLARTIYWRTVYQKEVIRVLETAVKVNQKNLQAAKKKIKNNLATGTDEIDFDQTKIQFNQDIQKAKILLINNMRQMAAILHHPSDTVYEVPDAISHDPDHQIDEFASEFEAKNHRNVKAIGALQLSQKLESEISSRWWAPKLNLYGLKTKTFETLKNPSDLGQDPGEVLGVKLTFFFDGFQSQVSSVADLYRSRGLDYLKHQIDHEVQTSYRNSYQLYQLNHDLVHSAEENNKLAQRYYDNVWNEYVRGIKNSPDVLQAFQRVVQAKLRYAEIKRDYQVARAEIQGFLEE